MTRPAQLTMLGRPTCENTAITRSRLEWLGVPFLERNIETDTQAEREVLARNAGQRVTPTIVLDGGQETLSEPTLTALGELLERAGHPHDPPPAVRFGPPLTARSLPLRTLPTVDGEPISLETLRGRRQALVLITHGVRCLACFGYARQLAQASGDEDPDSVAVVVVPDAPAAARGWRAEIDPAVWLLSDQERAWAREVARATGFPPDDVALVILDRYLAPRAGSHAAEAGGLMDPPAAVEWLRFLGFECPECTEELDWPT